ncbi:hypothetical protein MMC28_005304 [Mycoblastus sanguinarius]|nr:hypothetical protein [Mycoblastus sanguinarius]
MTSTKSILVLGATGKQGKSLINTILASLEEDSFTILALTRNPESASAKALAEKSSTIKLVKGNLDDCPAVFKAALEANDSKPIWGVFTVLQAVTDGATQEREEKQGKSMVDAALANNVKFFVYMSVERGVNTDTDPTYVPHFISKYNIEKYLEEKTKDGKMTYTILRPVAFMDGFTPDFMGKIFGTFLKISLKRSKPLQFIACTDIGFFASQAFLQPDSLEYRNKAISLAGDELTFDQVDQVFKQKLGYSVPTTFEFFARFVKWMLTELNIMFRWFDAEGFHVDIASLKRMHPGLMSVGDWLEKEGKFPKKK